MQINSRLCDATMTRTCSMNLFQTKRKTREHASPINNVGTGLVIYRKIDDFFT